MAQTIQQRLNETGQKPNGFDYMRILLALSVMLWHTVVICYGESAQMAVFLSPWQPLIALILPMFFALSGFLVAGSLERSKSLSRFLALRVLRIFPALAFETLVWALLAGPALTTISLHSYFTDPLFLKYFWNIIGHPQFYLPGLFEGNPTNKVNGQLWTVPYELKCYIVLTILALFGFAKLQSSFFYRLS